MNKKTTMWVVILLIVVAAVSVGVYAATKSTNTTSTTHEGDHHTDSGPHNQTSNDVATSATISATNDGFAPNTVTIKKGQSIKIVNNSSSDIEFSSADHPTHLEDPELNMETLKPSESGVVTPENVGTHGYHDHLNSGHTGKIVVTE
jgi:plastocyanin